MTETATPVIEVDVQDRVALLRFRRPAAANTIDMSFARELRAAALAIEANPDARAVVITGEGRHFCFGGDLQGMRAAAGDASAYLRELTATLHEGMAHLARLDAPVIAAVNGTAAGAGMGLVLVADVAIAARSAKFAPAYTGVGLTPDAGCTFLLPRAVGHKRAMELFLTNRVLDAATALEWGLVNQVVEDEALLATATELAARLAAGPKGAFGAVKRLMAEAQPGFEGQLRRESESMAARGATSEGREGIAAFLEKRPPRYD